jgi:UDP-N-acetylglucosamine 2-epimerase (non-hydrolysing)
MTRQNVAVVVGTRPEVIKMAPIVFALRDSAEYQPVLISTGQQREMLDQTLEVFGLIPDVELDLMAPRQSLPDLTARALTATSRTLADVAPAWTLVQGDTTTAFAAGLASFYMHIPVAHVEAGLRSGRRYAPFPEEINRRMLDQLSEQLFAPTVTAASRLRGEGFASSRIHVTGNTVVDALLDIRERLKQTPVSIPGLDESKLVGKRLVLVTAHRRESFGAPFMEMCNALVHIVRDNPDVVLVYPVHLNPNVQAPVRRILGDEERIILLPPLGYRELVTLLERSYFVLTDSGGIQEEAPTFGKPLLVMRDVTERPEGIDAGVARLVGTSAVVIRAEANRLLRDPAAHRAMAAAVNPYGDGTAALAIVHLLERYAARKAA